MRTNVAKIIPFPRREQTPPPKPPKRLREYLTRDEVDRLVAAALEDPHHRLRNATLILVSYVHGLRLNEALSMTWDQIDLPGRTLYVRRSKRGLSGAHPIPEFEAAMIQRHQTIVETAKEPSGGVATDGVESLVFRGPHGRLTKRAVQKMISKIAQQAGLGHLRVHPHMLRHGAGFWLGNLEGSDLNITASYLGHQTLVMAKHYSQLTPKKFANLWKRIGNEEN